MAKHYFSISKLLTVTIATCGAWQVTFAQDGEERALEEITVTAQKREQSLQEVPLSITALSGEKIENAGIDNLSDLSSFVPGMVISRGAIQTNIYIRGVGSGINRGFEQSVGMYIDGIYMGRGRQYRSPFLDVERVEVLRGPQGILFGKNTIAGAISVITRSPNPGDEFEFGADVMLEPEYGTQEYVGTLSGGLGENSAARLALKYKTSDGYIDNFTAGTEEPAVEELTGRLTLAWEPTDALSIEGKISFSDFQVDGSTAIARVFKLIDDPGSGFDAIAYGAVASGLADPTFAGGVDGFDTWRNIEGPGGSISPSFADFGIHPEQNDTETFNFSLNADWDVGPGTLTSVTGWSEYETTDGADVDFLPIQFIHRDDEHEFEQISQEIRYVSSGGEKVDYIFGAYVESQELTLDGAIFVDGTLGGLTPILTAPLGGLPTLFGAAVGLPIDYNVISRIPNMQQETDTLAVFGELTFNISDTFRITAGLRYSEVEKEAVKSLFIGSDTTGGVFVPADPNDLGAGTVLTALWGSPLFSTLPHSVSGKRSGSHVDPSVKVQWNATDNMMLYANYSEGFKSGGFNASDDLGFPDAVLIPAGFPFSTGDPEGFEYDDEEAKTIEFGLKSELGGGIARLNGSVFFTEYDNLQVSAFRGTNFVVGNAAASEIKGLELEAEWLATDNLTIGGSAAYLDFEYTDFPTAGCTAAQIAAMNGGATSSGLCSISADGAFVQNLTGQTSEYAPEWSGNVFFAYSRPVFNRLQFSSNLDINWSQEFFLDADLDPDSLQGDYTKINLRLGLGADDGRWEVAVFGRNLTEEKVFGSSNDTPLVTGSHTAYIEEPRVIGVSLHLRY